MNRLFRFLFSVAGLLASFFVFVPALSQQQIPKNTLIILERTGCLGTCPAYKVTISADGLFLSNGEILVAKAEKLFWRGLLL
jgi:hypothetical protein